MKPKHPRFKVEQPWVPGLGENKSAVCEWPIPQRISDMNENEVSRNLVQRLIACDEEIEPLPDRKEVTVRLKIRRATRKRWRPTALPRSEED